MTPAASPGYEAAVAGAAFALRPDRARVRVAGRDPAAMLQGILTNRVPEPPAPPAGGIAGGSALYAAVLTPKGRMVTDLRVVRGPRADDGLLLELPAAALEALLAHLRTYVPPRFASVADATSGSGQLTVAGPQAAALLSREALGLRVEAAELEALAEGGWIWLDAGGAGVLVLRSGELAAPSFEVIADADTAAALAARLAETGAVPMAPADLDLLGLEAGRPVWGPDMDETTLPPEAGIDRRAINHGKGCYTGQEVIVRIRDRGHVNRRLVGLRLGALPPPGPGAELWVEGRDRPVGTVTRAGSSPRAGETLALAWLRREVETPGEVRVGAVDGPPARAVALGDGWWRD